MRRRRSQEVGLHDIGKISDEELDRMIEALQGGIVEAIGWWTDRGIDGGLLLGSSGK